MHEQRTQQVSGQIVLDYLASAIEAFEQATKGGCIRHFYLIAGEVIEVQIAGETLAPFLTPALRHRAIPKPNCAPDLTIRAFDSESTGIELPRPIWPNDAFTSHTGLISGISNERVQAAFDVGKGVFNMLDSVSGQGIYWIRDGLSHFQDDMAVPFRTQLYWWMRKRKRYFVHGGAVSKENDGLLLVGKGGSGKSTSTLSCLEAGWNYLADDFVLIGLEPEAYAYNVYQSARVNPDHYANHFTNFANSVTPYMKPVRAKTLLMLNDCFPGRIASECKLRALVFPRIADVPSPRLLPIESRQSFVGMVGSTLLTVPGVTPQDLKQMAAVVNHLPNYALEIGGDPRQIPPLLEELLNRLRQ
jgi:hypothetical protein